MKDVWKVYFNGSFGGKSPDGSHPGQALELNHKFRFAGRDWYVPAAYLTAKGLVLDILMRADKAALEDFCKKWEHLEDEDMPTMYSNRRSAKIRWLLSFRRKLS